MKTFYTNERETWREWLAEHFETESEIWFVFPMKESGEKALSYNDAVEEALCFGWIDSTIKHIDPTHRAQRFTPRKKGSPYSRPNIERLIWLDGRGMLHPSVRDSVLPLIRAPYVFPTDIVDAIKADAEAFENYPESVRRSGAMRAFYDNCGEDEQMAIRLHKAVMSSKMDGFRNNPTKENRIKRALYHILKDDDMVERLYKIVVEQEEY